MAAKKSSSNASSGKVVNLTPAQLRAIWNDITIADWLALLEEYRPSSNWKLKGNTIKGLCFRHAEESPSLSVHVGSKYAHCFSAACPKPHTWDPIRFFADVAGMTLSAAVTELKRRYRIKLPNAFANNIQKIDDNEQVKHAIMHACHAEFIDALNSQAPEYDYIHNRGLVPWLQKRQLPLDTAHLWPVGVLPTRDRLIARIKENGEEKHTQAAVDYLKSHLSLPGAAPMSEGMITFFCFATPTSMGRIKLRAPSDDKTIYIVDDAIVERVGFFGLSHYAQMTNLADHPVIVVEGEMDALSVISRQAANGLDACSEATGGTAE